MAIIPAQATEAPRDARAGHHRRNQFSWGCRAVLWEGIIDVELICATSLSFSPLGGRGTGAPRSARSSCSSLKLFILSSCLRFGALKVFVAARPSPGGDDI